MTWTRQPDQKKIDHGFMALHDFQDHETFTITLDANTVVNQPVYPAMIYPVVIYSNPSWQVTVSLKRTFSATQIVSLARPIVLPGICSWFIEQ
jgi:hypothetical protein